jgi:transposase
MIAIMQPPAISQPENRVSNIPPHFVILSELIRGKWPGRKMIGVPDHSRWHHGEALEPWLFKQRKKLRLHFLPLYNLDLNYVKGLWKFTCRLGARNQYFATLEQLIDSVQFRMWNEPNERVRVLCEIA